MNFSEIAFVKIIKEIFPKLYVSGRIITIFAAANIGCGSEKKNK